MTSPKTLHVVFFGDSICFGQGVSPHLGWVTRLSADLERVAAGLNSSVRLTNTSINGNTTRMALERMPFDVQSHGVDLIVIQFGMNDCNHWQTDGGHPRVSIKAFAANIEEMIDRARRFGARRIILNTNHTSGRDTEPMLGTHLSYEENNARYNEAVRNIARASGSDTCLVDMEAAFRRRRDLQRNQLEPLLQKDLLHLSAAGHDLYYETMRPPLMAAFTVIVQHDN